MGFFSWKTKDTNRSIANRHSERPTFTVYMHDHKGLCLKEESYDGYGLFGGVDYYELLAMMNDESANRDEGIDLAFRKDTSKVIWPQLTESPDSPAPDEFFTPNENCEYQGFFYP